jgi:hypothetical protein
MPGAILLIYVDDRIKKRIISILNVKKLKPPYIANSNVKWRTSFGK